MTSLKNYTQYPAIITQYEDGFDVEVAGSHTCGATREEAEEMAKALVIDMAETQIYLRRRVPESAEIEGSNYMVRLSPTTGLKLMLWNAMYDRHVTKSQLARLMSTSPQSVAQTLSLASTATRFDSLCKAFDALGMDAEISFR